ncbi:polyketide cyclase [Legionella pneumophila]|uniref:nuclear transport factor 2 family protein n=1 Tax=Legionella pneumophila TaxID=446 RepID=UPI0007708A26|nr:ester cyclase [Legionella pneumophila]HRD69528.1 ester cyclase [Legionella sp.]MDF1929597.1 ester cyclase [Legionella pneumophila]PYB42899.1 polyketide cyclase [Legionella pneumophila]PYB48118.1 polyketide cyclase [Legionella pneumophila]PYB60703.1 polyketide cyclase [Legionella pneumophila]
MIINKSKIFAISLLLSIINNSYAFIDEQQKMNKQIVTEFYNKAINQKNFEAASKYLGANYKQHNPAAADGPEGLKAFIQYLIEYYPNSHSEIKKIFTDGDYVILHVHSIREPGTRGRAIFDLFKLEDGKIIEHWDAIQDIPVKSANSNSMF